MLADLDRYREEQNQLELQQQASVLYKAHIWLKYLTFENMYGKFETWGNEIGAVLQIGYELVPYIIQLYILMPIAIFLSYIRFRSRNRNSISASSDTVESEGRQMKQWFLVYILPFKVA